MSGPRRRDRKSVRTLFPPDLLVQRLHCTDKADAISELLNALVVQGSILDLSREESTRQAILDREGVASTGIGNGVAIPHTKTKFAEKLAVSVGLSEEGIDFGAHDGQTARIIFLWVCPPSATKEHLALMRAISTVARDEKQSASLANTRDRKTLLDALDRIPVEGKG